MPNGISSTITPSLIKKGLKVIDLSADYRYKSLELWKEVYSDEASIYERNDHELCQEAVYGLTEIYKKEISKARLIASPGCYPTSSLLPLIPFLSQGIIESEGIIIDSIDKLSINGLLSIVKKGYNLFHFNPADLSPPRKVILCFLLLLKRLTNCKPP